MTASTNGKHHARSTPDRMSFPEEADSPSMLRRGLPGMAGQSLKQGGRVVGQHSRALVGIDTSKLRNAVAIAEEGRGGDVRYLGEIDTAEAATAHASHRGSDERRPHARSQPPDHRRSA